MLALSIAFVLDSSSTPSAPTAHNFEQLLDLLLDEKHFRSQLEQQVRDLRDELATEKLAFGQQSNRTLAELDAFQRAFNKEKSNRFHLEQAYTRLTIEFHNLSLDHDALKKNNKDLEKQLQNVSDNHDVLKRKHDALASLNAVLDEKVKNLTGESMDDKRRLAIVDNDIIAMNQTFISSLSIVHTDIATNRANIATNRVNIGTNRADIATNHANIVTDQADLAEIKRKQGKIYVIISFTFKGMGINNCLKSSSKWHWRNCWVLYG